MRTEVPTDLEEKMKKSETSFEQLWDPYGSQYFSRDFITHRLLKEPSIAALMPLYAGCITKERAATIVRMLEDEHLFGTPFPVPSVPVNSSWFNENSFWQGPSWINTNWFIIDGLKRYGYFDHAAALTDVSIELTEKAGFYEYFNPLNGIGLGSPDFSWTAALIIDLLKTADGKKYLKGLSV